LHHYERLLHGGDLPPLARPFTPLARLTWVLYHRLLRDKAFLRAAGMAYNTLVALVPLLMLVFGVLGLTGALEQDPAALEDLIFGSFLGNIPEVRAFLLPGLVGVDLSAMGLVGVGGLLVVAMRLYAQVELGYNEIFGAVLDRPLWMRLMYFYVTATLAPLLLFAAALRSSDLMAAIGLDGPLLATLSNLSGLFVQFTLQVVALKAFPCTAVPWRSAWTGAAVSALLLVVTGHFFSAYLTFFAADDPVRVIYGSVGVLPVFLLWLYLAWLSVLIGVEVAALAHTWEAFFDAEFRAMREGREGVGRAADEVSLLLVAAQIAARFLRGDGPTSAAELAAAAGLQERDVMPLLRVLEDARAVCRSGEGWTLQRPPDRIEAAALLRDWRARTSAHTAAPAETEAQLASLAARLDGGVTGTLADLVRELPGGPAVSGDAPADVPAEASAEPW
jgi:membrane protein